MRFVRWIELIALDVRYGIRQLVKAPMVTVAVVLSLAVGIGANTAIFRLVDAAILRPLPVPDPGSLVVIQWSNEDGFPQYVSHISGDAQNTPGGGMIGSSFPALMIRRLAGEPSGLEAIVGISDPDEVAAAVGTGPAEQVDLQYVSANFFEGMKVTPVLGRPFLEQEDRVGELPALIVSHRFWMSRLGGSASAVGRALRVNDVTGRIVGVAPPGFFGMRAGQWTDLYAPLAARSVLDRTPAETTPEDPTNWWVRAVGRLAEGVPESAATARLSGLFRSQVAELAGPDAGSLPALVPSPGRRGFDSLDDQSQTALWLLLLLVALLLLIVCANVANLLLARSESRQHDCAVRLTLGAPASRLFRQQLIESMLLALIGGAAGLMLGFALSNVIHDLFETARDASNAFALQTDLRVVGFTVAISTAAAVLFGLTPALRAARSEPSARLNMSSRSITGTRLRGPRALVSAQLALCLGALVAAGLLGRSLHRLAAVDLGFDPENLVYATVNPSLSGYPAERVEGYLADVQSELEALPGVTAVSRLERRPLEGGGRFSPVNIPGRPRAEGFDPAFVVSVNSVGPEMLETLAIPLLAGRNLSRDGSGVVVDERFADRFFEGQNALGRRFGIGGPGNDDQYEIVGIARNTVSLQLRADPLPTLYVPLAAQSSPATHFAVRAAVDPDRLLGAIRTAVSSVDASVPLMEVHTQTELLDRMLRTERLLAFLSGGFGLVATALGAIGLAGLLSYAVARRTSEIGLRMALGAAPGGMVRMVMQDSLKMVMTGLLVGLPCAYGIARLLASNLYEIAPLDPATMAASVLALLAISLAAAFIPARRAASTDPIAALREE